jgi:hypothetical protein
MELRTVCSTHVRYRHKPADSLSANTSFLKHGSWSRAGFRDRTPKHYLPTARTFGLANDMLAVYHEGVCGSGCIGPHFLDLDTSWRWVVSFTPRPLYPLGKNRGTHTIGCWVDLRAGLDDVEKRKFLTLPGLGFQPLSRPTRSQSLYRLRYPGSSKYLGNVN